MCRRACFWSQLIDRLGTCFTATSNGRTKDGGRGLILSLGRKDVRMGEVEPSKKQRFELKN